MALSGSDDDTCRPETEALRRCLTAQERTETERATIAQALQESEEKFRTICASAQDAVLMQNDAGQITFWNEAATRIFGYSESEAMGQELHVLLAPQRYLPAYRTGLSLFRDSGSGPAVGKTLELAAQRRDGTEFPIELSLSAVKLQGRWHAIGIVRDISERKQAEAERERLLQQLQHSQKLEAIGTLAGGVAHDMNNILGAIMMLASVLRGHVPAESSRRRDVEDILAACRRGRDLTKNLLGFARKGTVFKENVSLNLKVEKIEGLLQRTIPRNITIDVHLDPELPDVEGDASQLYQALMNVALNAVDAMPQGGTLRFATRTVVVSEADTADALGLPPGRYAVVAIADTGIGMDRHTRERAFEPFFTTKPLGKATGLGLSMVFGTVKHHGGTVTIDSTEGKGTIVTIHLPVRPMTTAAEVAPPHRAAVVASAHKTVLLVEDEVLVRDGTQRLLEELGFCVRVAGNGQTALDEYHRFRQQIDLVLLDLIMPVMDGEESLRQLKALDPTLPVILCSGYATEEKKAELLKLGAATVLQKPFDAERLSAVLAEPYRAPRG